MQLSQNCMSTLRQWLAGEWHTQHPTDMKMFFKFVNAYIVDHGYSVDEKGLRNLMADQLRIDHHSEQTYLISERISLMYQIMDFVRATGR